MRFVHMASELVSSMERKLAGVLLHEVFHAWSDVSNHVGLVGDVDGQRYWFVLDGLEYHGYAARTSTKIEEIVGKCLIKLVPGGNGGVVPMLGNNGLCVVSEAPVIGFAAEAGFFDCGPLRDVRSADGFAHVQFEGEPLRDVRSADGFARVQFEGGESGSWFSCVLL